MKYSQSYEIAFQKGFDLNSLIRATDLVVRNPIHLNPRMTSGSLPIRFISKKDTLRVAFCLWASHISLRCSTTSPSSFFSSNMPVDTYTQAKLFVLIMMDPDHTFREALTTDPSIVPDNNSVLEVRDAYNHIQRLANQGTLEEFRDLCALLKDDLRRVEEEIAAANHVALEARIAASDAAAPRAANLTEFRYAVREARRFTELYASSADGMDFYLEPEELNRLTDRILRQFYLDTNPNYTINFLTGDNRDNDENAPPADENNAPPADE